MTQGCGAFLLHTVAVADVSSKLIRVRDFTQLPQMSCLRSRINASSQLDSTGLYRLLCNKLPCRVASTRKDCVLSCNAVAVYRVWSGRAEAGICTGRRIRKLRGVLGMNFTLSPKPHASRVAYASHPTALCLWPWPGGHFFLTTKGVRAIIRSTLFGLRL